MSPEFMLRPSLSGLVSDDCGMVAFRSSVAGVYAPAFVERLTERTDRAIGCPYGVYATDLV